MTVYRSQGKQIYSLFPISRQCPATFQEAGLQYTEQLFWKTEVIIMNDIGAGSNQHLSGSEHLHSPNLRLESAVHFRIRTMKTYMKSSK